MKLKPDRWLHIIAWPFTESSSDLREWAAEARKMAAALATMAREEAVAAFDAKLAESLEDGGAWMHRWITNDQAHGNHKEQRGVHQ